MCLVELTYNCQLAADAAAVSVDGGNIFGESSSLDDVLLEFADQLTDTALGESASDTLAILVIGGVAYR